MKRLLGIIFILILIILLLTCKVQRPLIDADTKPTTIKIKGNNNQVEIRSDSLK